MWNRRETETAGTDPQPVSREIPSAPPREFGEAPSRDFAESPPRPVPAAKTEETVVNIGQSICIKGELTGGEDLTIEGTVEGKIDLKDHHLTIGPNGQIRAEIEANRVVIKGEINGNVTAREKIELLESGRVKGDMVAPRVVIADGARFKGTVDMSAGREESPRQSSSKETSKSKGKPEVSATPALVGAGKAPEASAAS